MNTATVDQENTIHLSVGTNEGDRVNPYVPIRWCISPELLQIIKNFWETETPLLLLIISHNKKEIFRKVVLLQEEMDYLTFQRPGEHTIQATIVFCTDGSQESVASCLVKYNGDLRDVISCNQLREISHFINYQKGNGQIVVEVDSAFFSKRPANWLWNWVNYWYETQPRDQCQFRRRSLLAFSIQPPVLLGWVVLMVLIRTIIATTLRFGCGFKGVDFYPIISPFRFETREIWTESANRSIFLSDASGQSRHWIFLIFMPIIALPLLISIAILTAVITPELYYFKVTMLMVGIYCTFGLIACLEWVIGKMFPTVFNRMTKSERRDFYEDKKRQKEQTEAKELAQWREQTFSSLVCTGVPRPASVQALPPERRTVYLRFMALKAKVCKPFSK